ncbi:HypC/HybG/HupF family hydrogenase formation chaperone [Telmatospirillum siberiense]|uniref:HypC/HybG/HupF family hydrogenase formation chaperone n=1 Tax=Telmatospirillum siberiense TaxID=382514 RepID=A0A2N3PPN0_9PROT|nr:HypC/HybG/HupF family hydrogenase formation chaperone [Telmatospirillum siberiense]PKU22371.1 HypC/HybG/HupF family hydrogenase formation chaperone [Telmatospirillum siberiense]
MCIALPVKIVAILDAGKSLVLVEGAGGQDEVSAALVADETAAGADLLGRWAVVHSGFVLSLMDEREARSRLAVFAAMEGRPVASDDLRPDFDDGADGPTFP